jgi:2-oxoglutarate ferredoxin oxidoreductase subunit beta
MADNNDKSKFLNQNEEIAWCPGCGNFKIRPALAKALDELEVPMNKLVMVSGIGQAAKAPHYMNTNFFNGLHGRAVPPATAIKMANPELTVIIESGDGDMYGEGGNHFIHAIRRNPDITAIIHNNMIYGLTKGQASPTSREDMETPVQVQGVILQPFNPLTTSLALNASFVARVNCADEDKTKEVFKRAVQHKGFAIVDTLQVCVSFNKLNTYKWFKEHTYYLEEEYNPKDRIEAMQRASETDPMPLGIFYADEDRDVFEDLLPIYQKDKTPLYKREFSLKDVDKLIESL